MELKTLYQQQVIVLNNTDIYQWMVSRFLSVFELRVDKYLVRKRMKQQSRDVLKRANFFHRVGGGPEHGGLRLVTEFSGFNTSRVSVEAQIVHSHAM